LITPDDIGEILARYNNEKTTVATICSHSALQIFWGARQEGFRTLGICKPGVKKVYDSFPLAKPDEYLMVEDYSQVLDEETQEKLRGKDAIVIPHGSFVEYVGPRNIEERFAVPMFGNRRVLEWEGNRQKEKHWLQHAGLEIPREFVPSEINRLCVVKFQGAKGGRGLFLARSQEEFEEKLQERIETGKLTARSEPFIQEYAMGLRYYPHYFYSPLLDRVELLGIDRRDESNVDSLHRLGLTKKEIEQTGTYVVTGNLPLVVRESLLPQLMEMGERTVESSLELFPPGMIGPFCLETVCLDDMRFITFEISARIVGGTNLYPMGSPYSCYLFSEPMSVGRRISRELKLASQRNELEKVVY